MTGFTAFISYSREDIGFVSELANDLQLAGVEVWLGKYSIVSGENWVLSTQKALESCEYFIVVLSPASMNSDYVLGTLSALEVQEEK